MSFWCDYTFWQTVFSGFTTAGVIIVVVQYLLTKKQLHQATIARCIDTFRNMENIDSTTTERALLKKYIDLVNEELFYIQHGYIPDEIALEWIDGMLDILPVYSTVGEKVNLPYTNEELVKHYNFYFPSFPRISNSFLIKNELSEKANSVFADKSANSENRIEVRRLICKEIRNRVKKYRF